MPLTINKHPYLSAFATLALSSAVCIALASARAVRSFSLSPLFLVWNLFLAWVPLWAAAATYRLRRARFGIWLAVPSGLVWLLFLPNAPYILTDLVHLRADDNPLAWYDLLMLLWFGWTGFVLGMASLYLMQKVVTERAGALVGWVFAMVSLAMAGYGVYLGRFLRWNSWDVFVDPLALLADIYTEFRHPLTHFQSHAFWMILAMLLVAAYVTMAAPLIWGRRPSS